MQDILKQIRTMDLEQILLIKAAVSNRLDSLKDNVRDESSDNYIIENQANSIIDFSETNPFGSI